MKNIDLSQETVRLIRAHQLGAQETLFIWSSGYQQAPAKDQLSWLRLCWEHLSPQQKNQMNPSVTALETALSGWERETRHPTSRMVAESWKTLAKSRLKAVEWPETWTMLQRKAVIWSIAQRIGEDFDQPWIEDAFPQAATQHKLLGGTIVQMLMADMQQNMLDNTRTQPGFSQSTQMGM